MNSKFFSFFLLTHFVQQFAEAADKYARTSVENMLALPNRNLGTSTSLSSSGGVRTRNALSTVSQRVHTYILTCVHVLLLRVHFQGPFHENCQHFCPPTIFTSKTNFLIARKFLLTAARDFSKYEKYV